MRIQQNSNRGFDENGDPADWTDIGGYTKPSGRIERAAGQLPAFVPRLLPPDIRLDRDITKLVIRAEKAAAELKGIGRVLENPDLFNIPYIKHEAVYSSKIEGTAASLDDVNRREAVGIGAEEGRRLRIQEVANYVEAFKAGLSRLEHPERALDLGTISHLHRILMSGVRDYDDVPGEFRNCQNVIARFSGREIVYVPPPHGMVPQLLANLVEFMQDESYYSPLVKCAIAHYQFEAIHPFIDGNGRVGRLLIPLMLHQSGTMPEPLLNISAYIDRHKQEYYHVLRGVSKKGRWKDLLAFFLGAFIEQSGHAIENIQKIISLEKQYKNLLYKRKKSSNSIVLLASLFGNPYITIPNARRALQSTREVAESAINDLVDVGIIRPVSGTRSPIIFVAGELTRILRDV